MAKTIPRHTTSQMVRTLRGEEPQALHAVKTIGHAALQELRSPRSSTLMIEKLGGEEGTVFPKLECMRLDLNLTDLPLWVRGKKTAAGRRSPRQHHSRDG